MLVRLLLLLIISAPLSLSYAQEVVVYPSRDAVIYSEDAFDDAARANGEGPVLYVGSLQQSAVRRILITFDVLSKIPAGSTITSARLSLKPVTLFSNPALSLFRIQEVWTTGESKPDLPEFGTEALEDDVTWNYRSYNEDEDERLSWQRAGGTVNLERPLIQALGVAEEDRILFESDAFAEDLQMLLDQPNNHYGYMIVGDEGIAGALQAYHGLEAEKEEDRPYLEIEYTERDDFEAIVSSYNTLQTVAGRGKEDNLSNHWKPTMEGGPARSAELSRPATAIGDPDGNIYIVDTRAHAVRKVTPEGTIHTVAGTNVAGFNGDGPALDTQLDRPNGLYLTGEGSLFILDSLNQRIRKLGNDGIITTVVHDETLAGGLGLWVSPDGSLIYYSSGTVLKKWEHDSTGGTITTIAENFDQAANLDVDPRNGDIVIADIERDRVYRVKPDGSGIVTIAGGGIGTVTDRPALDIVLDGTRGIAVLNHGGYFLTTVEAGDLWYVDPNHIAHRLIRGSRTQDFQLGDGETLEDIVENESTLIAEPQSVTVAPNGDLIMITNPSGLVRVVRKFAGPTLGNVGHIGANGAFQINWNSLTGRTYVVEGSADLASWTRLTVITASGTSLNYQDPEHDQFENRFYRVRLYP